MSKKDEVQLSPIEDVIAAIGRGEMIVMVDDGHCGGRDTVTLMVSTAPV